jgi:hypothetical protein
LRSLTYFNTFIPPWKEENAGAGASWIRLVISGNVPSKKNNQMAVAIRRDAKDFLFSKQKSGEQVTFTDAIAAIDMVYAKMRANEAYASFLKEQKPKIQQQLQAWSARLYEKGVIFPLRKASLNLKLYFKDRYVTDTVNKQQTIQDLLIDCGVIAKDDYKTLNPITSASACYYEEMIENLAVITLSFKLPKDNTS